MKQFSMLIIFALSFTLVAHAQDTEATNEVLSAINQLPDKSLSLSYILDQGMKNSDSFKAIMGSIPATKAPMLLALAPLDIYLTALYSVTDDNREESHSSLNSIENLKTYSLGISKLFITGTTLSANIESSQAGINASSFTCNTAFTTNLRCDIDQSETKITLGLEQNLWKDFFGYSTRKQVNAGELQSASLQEEVVEAAESWTLGIANTYYMAWFNKQQVIAAREKAKRQNELSRITKLRVNRGSSARPELLQIESAALAAESEEQRFSEELNKAWRLLVATVKLKKSWYNIDPVRVPLSFETPSADLDNFCANTTSALTKNQTSSNSNELEVFANNTKVKKMRYAAEASNSRLAAERMNARPDLRIFGQYGSNAYDESFGKSFTEAGDFNQTFWTLGAKLSMPLGFRQNRALVYNETSNKMRSEAQASDAVKDIELEFLESCANLERFKADKKRLEMAVTKQKERARLEQERFRNGRIPILNAISANNDLSDTELLFFQNEVQQQLAYWNLRKLRGNIAKQLKERAVTLE